MLVFFCTHKSAIWVGFLIWSIFDYRKLYFIESQNFRCSLPLWFCLVLFGINAETLTVTMPVYAGKLFVEKTLPYYYYWKRRFFYRNHLIWFTHASIASRGLEKINVHRGVMISLFDTADQTDYLPEENTHKGKKIGPKYFFM